ncbi:S8 family serine peptidase [Brachybacterium sp. UNK5269]|uniref:S8 family serine peptidase n=1 Tax=Brachybacterium sp. UNK5269 TaxID=3408576 RepID=UPI003BB159FA
MIEPGLSPHLIHSASGPLLTSPPETTGRYIVVFAADTDAPSGVLRKAAGLMDVTPSQEYGAEAATATTSDTVFETLGLAVVSADPEQVGALRTSVASDDAIMSVSPELVHHPLDNEYARGYADGVGDLTARLGTVTGGGGPVPGATGPVATTGPLFADTAEYTWGLQAVGADGSTASGAGVAVAVLDTGFDLEHPDFANRTLTPMSFIPGEDPQDGHGHGTHCIGTALGPLVPDTGPRYGVAHGADIFAGKVLSNSGSGSDGGILAGIEWAITSGCSIISMSLGADVPKAHPPYVAAGKRALDLGVLIIAAAGNNARRQQQSHGFVGAPANSPYILAVGALDPQLDIAVFSSRTLIGGQGGQVDLAGPGVAVYSSWPMPTRYRAINGTSMATPHGAGLAALWSEVTGFRGRELWATLVEHSTRLILPSLDVGSGLAIAP